MSWILAPRKKPGTVVVDGWCQEFGVTATLEEDCFSIRRGNQVMLLNTKHAIYGSTLAKNFDVYFSAVVAKKKRGLQIADYSRPKVHKLKNGLRFEFSSFPEEIEAIDDYFYWYKATPGDTIFDLGAHCGLSVYYFSKAVGPGGRVICFEPDPGNLEVLRRNIIRHKLANVTIVASAIGGEDGEVLFSAEGTIGSQMIRHLPRESVGTVLNVPMMSLKTAFEKYGVPNLCKIDIEGAEIEALTSAALAMACTKSNFVVDTNHLVGGGYTNERVEDIFRSAGYETYTMAKTFLTTYARPSP